MVRLCEKTEVFINDWKNQYITKWKEENKENILKICFYVVLNVQVSNVEILGTEFEFQSISLHSLSYKNRWESHELINSLQSSYMC